MKHRTPGRGGGGGGGGVGIPSGYGPDKHIDL